MPTNPPLGMRRKLIGAAVESTSGTPETVSAALTNTMAYDVKAQAEGLYDEGERKPHGHYHGTVDAVLGAHVGKLTFRTELIFNDGLMTLLQGCGFTTSGGGASPTVATPNSDLSAHKTLTFRIWEDGRYKVLAGAVGTFTLEAEAGGRVFANWDFSGIWQAPVDGAMPAFAPVTAQSYRAQAITLTVGGSALPQMDGFTLDAAREIEPRQTVTTASGLAHFLVSDRQPTLTLAPEARLVAGHDAWGLLLAGTTAAVQIILTNPASKTLTIDAARAQRLSVTDDERDKKLVDSIELGLHNSAGDDDLKFTEAATA